jgi:hypothetical protein
MLLAMVHLKVVVMRPLGAHEILGTRLLLL